MTTFISISKINQVAVDNEPCGCPACDDGVQPDHFACEQASKEMLELERTGRVIRSYDDSVWRWYAV